MKKMPQVQPIGTLPLYMIVLVAIISLREYPIMASQGLHAIFYYLVAFLFFLLPSALICAELSTRYPIKGGVYSWVKLAFGERAGFIVMWIEWINNLISFPASLAMIVATFAFVFIPRLEQHHILFFICMMVCCWGSYFISAFGIKVSSGFSLVGALVGILIPSLGIMLLGCVWVWQHPVLLHSVSLSQFVPHWNFSSLAVYVTVLSSFAGMQAAAFYAQDVKNPVRAYPRAFIWGSLTILLLAIGGTLAILVVVPQNNIDFITGLIGSFKVFFTVFHLKYLTYVIAATIALAALASMNTWLTALSRGMQQMAEEDVIPIALAKLNKHGMSTRILFTQCLVISILSCLFWILPHLQAAFWLLIALTSQLTVLMYLGLFASAIRLHDLYPKKVKEGFSIPGGRKAVIVCAMFGMLSALVGFICGFFPPAKLHIPLLQYIPVVLIIDAIILSFAFLFPKWMDYQRRAMV